MDVLPNAGRTYIRVDVFGLRPKKLIRAPKGATHAKLLLAAISMSDFVVNGDAGYVPQISELNGLHSFSDSGLLPLNGGLLSPFLLEAVFANVTSFPVQVSVVVAMGIEFYQQVAGVDYLLEEGKCMDVVEVF